MRWIEVPQYRVIELTASELANDFTSIDADGKECGYYSTAFRWIRKSNHQVFMKPVYHRESIGTNEQLFFLQELL